MNLEASIRARLLNIAKARGEEFQTVLSRYGVERLLYRLANSTENQRFILKGAVLFYIWEGELHRPTRDVDFLGLGDSSPDALVATFRSICGTPVDPDGPVFLPDSIHAAPIREENDYGGLRLTIMAMLGNARIPLQVDVRFGDAVTPGVERVEFPTLLDLPAPIVSAYPAESVIAEKYQAIMALGIANTRMKDFYDLFVLSETHMFDGATLVDAITATFARRRTPLTTTIPLPFTPAFGNHPEKQAQWHAFMNRSKLTDAPAELSSVTERLAGFLWPLTEAARSGAFDRTWLAGVGWQ